MDTTKKIIIGAIGAAVVVGAVSIGLIFGLAPADTDLSTIHTQEATSVPEAQNLQLWRKVLLFRKVRLLKKELQVSAYSLRLILPEIFPFNIRW